MKYRWLYVVGLVILAGALVFTGISSKKERKSMINENSTTNTNLRLISPAFSDGAAIPTSYTCKGQNVNPPLNIMGVPAGAKSLALIMHDPDAVSGDFVHWLMREISPTIKTIDSNSVPVGAIQGVNSAGRSGYMGPCPPAGTGTHHYIFELYALDSPLTNLDRETNRDQLKKAMQGHMVAQTTLTGLFSAD